MAEELKSGAVTRHPGGLWEFDDWELRRDHEVERHLGDGGWGPTPCPHMVLVRTVVKNSSWTVEVWRAPLVIVARNEAGCNTTGLCALCVAEALRASAGLA